MVHFKENYNFSRLQGWSNIFQWAYQVWGWMVKLLIPADNYRNCYAFDGTYQQSCSIKDGRSKYRVVHYWHYQRYADFKCVSSFAFS